jgi:hypothetical protein
MKPLSIADYLDHLGRAAGEKAPPRPETRRSVREVCQALRTANPL